MTAWWMAAAAVAAALAVAGGALYALLAERAAGRRLAEAERRHFEELQAVAEARFRDISARLLDERARRLEADGSDALARLVAPLMRDIAAFRRRVDEINSEGSARVGALREKIEGLVRQTNAVSKEANNLATAIRADAQVTGQWGEMQLRRVLELGGLAEGVDYTYQETFASEGTGRRDQRADVIVKMPGERCLVIDAKTTMAAYLDYVAADGADAVREEARRRIVESVRAHVDELKRADYAKGLAAAGRRVLGTVLMYIPFEEVYLLAMKAEVTVNGRREPLREYARRGGVVMVNAACLLPVVRLVAELWDRDNADAKARRITEAAEGLVRKFRGFLEEFEAVGTHLAASTKAYNTALNRLAEGNGNVMKRLNDLKGMGVPAAAALKAPEELKEA